VVGTRSNRKIIGILGGMGPLATIELERRIVLYNTKAQKDQDHVPMIVINDPRVPDRTAYILGEGPDPRPKLIEGLRKLEACGVDMIFIPCNTAHAFYDDLRRATKLPIYHMPYRAIQEASKLGKRIFLLATLGTYLADVYGKTASRIGGVEILYPSNNVRELVMDVIYGGVKSGRDVPEENIKNIVSLLKDVEVIILGCTELSVLKEKFKKYVSVIDPLDVAAYDAIKFSRGEISEKELILK